MVDMVANGTSLWAGSGYGLNRTDDSGMTWTGFTSADYIGKGGVSALGMMDDSTLWIATAFDTTVRDIGALDAGGGLSYTRDMGKTWTHFRQPIDSRDETEYRPTTTNVQNLTFDIAFLDSVIWITSWGGGLRKSEDMGKTWQVVTVDGKPFDANAGTNSGWRHHVTFSVINVGDSVLWVGTAAGISKSKDGGSTWRHFSHQNQDLPISGNFVVAMGHQPATGTIWAATIQADTDTSEFRAVSKSDDGGESWQTFLSGTFAHNFAFYGDYVYVASDDGMYVTNNGGADWYILPEVRDYITGEILIDKEYFSAAVTTEGLANRFWAGNGDGIASTIDNGNTWKVHRSFLSTRKAETPDVYAYPSPFSPSRSGYIRFQYDITRAGEIIIDIYDFSMDHVVTIRENESFPSEATYDRNARWDGKNEAGMPVASGVYFFRVNVEGKISWGKLVIIN
ncbi:MAG: hypothetical protein E4H13_03760 [Calditrichales bacterium]|nr:MAG: hypothetical protein E4H13_03760 [Calditrichales bacterium]